jgi:hypothetical protein
MDALTLTAGSPAQRRPAHSHPPALAALRRSVLEALKGPEFQPAHAVPRRWPILRAHVLGVVAMLWQEGLLERTADPHSGGALPIYRATAAGLERLADATRDV